MMVAKPTMRVWGMSIDNNDSINLISNNAKYTKKNSLKALVP